MEIRRYKFVAEDIRLVGKKPRSPLLDAATVKCIVNTGVESPRKRSGRDVSDDAGQNPARLEENYRRSEPRHGAVSACGRRREMEDAMTILPSFADDGRLHFFGVYDGHGGPHAALLCRDRLHGILKTEIMSEPGTAVIEEAQWQRALVSAFLRMDNEVGGLCSENDTAGENEVKAPDTVGSTAVVAIVGSEQIVLANCGDSRAVLSRGGEAIPLSADHKPNRADEMARIEAAGGRVIFWNGYRVMGVLATSRSIGDRYLKPYVIPVPDVTFSPRCPDDECLILATDGLWDVVSNEMACDIARRCLSGRLVRKRGKGLSSAVAVEENPAAMAAALLTKLAFARGSSDNISVVVVDLKQPAVI